MGRTLIIVLCIAYILNPLDVIPDIVPIAGFGDDLIAALIGLRTLANKPKGFIKPEWRER